MTEKTQTFASRFSIALKSEKPHAFSIRSGISNSVLRKYLKGDADPGLSKVVQIANLLDVSVEWLATGLEHNRNDLHAKLTNNTAFLAIPVVNATASAGAGALIYDESKAGHVLFDAHWLRATYQVNPDDLCSLPVIGDSMAPNINDGEYVLVMLNTDYSKIGEGVYVIRLDGDLLIKRIQKLPGLRLKISSDNPLYQPYEVDMKAGIDFAIIGKVIFAHGIRRI